jgi:hypothetical protein
MKALSEADIRFVQSCEAILAKGDLSPREKEFVRELRDLKVRKPWLRMSAAQRSWWNDLRARSEQEREPPYDALAEKLKERRSA